MKKIIGGVLVLGVGIYLLCSLISLWGDLSDQKEELALLKDKYATQKAEITELKALLEADSDAQIIESAARERLGYIYSGEKVFIDISGN